MYYHKFFYYFSKCWIKKRWKTLERGTKIKRKIKNWRKKVILIFFKKEKGMWGWQKKTRLLAVGKILSGHQLHMPFFLFFFLQFFCCIYKLSIYLFYFLVWIFTITVLFFHHHHNNNNNKTIKQKCAPPKDIISFSLSPLFSLIFALIWNLTSFGFWSIGGLKVKVYHHCLLTCSTNKSLFKYPKKDKSS